MLRATTVCQTSSLIPLKIQGNGCGESVYRIADSDIRAHRDPPTRGHFGFRRRKVR